MTFPLYKNQHTDELVIAGQFDGENCVRMSELAEPVSVCWGADNWDGDILVADRRFPMWLRKGEWLTRSTDGELDVWAHEHFVVTFQAALTEKAGA